MRLFILPISTRRSLLYAQRINQHLSTENTRLDWLTRKASATWVNWEKKDSGWQKKVTAYGNSLFQRLPYQEWGLKSIPPLSTRRKSKDIKGTELVQVQYPEALLDPPRISEVLRMYSSDEKQKFHGKWMWGSIIGMPVTAPVAIIPIIPNLPFFYLCFRAWSHWRARGGSQHLRFLLQSNLVQPSPSKLLDLAYMEAKLDKWISKFDMGTKPTSQNTYSQARADGTAEEMLLSRSSGQAIADCLEVPELAMEIKRAVWQVERSLQAKQELKEEKQDMETATRKPGS